MAAAQSCQVMVRNHHLGAGQAIHHQRDRLMEVASWRIIARKSGARARIWTRHGKQQSASFVASANALRFLPMTSCVLDGEGRSPQRRPAGPCRPSACGIGSDHLVRDSDPV